MSDLLESLNHYFATTPREQIMADWAESGEATKGINSPTIGEFIAMQKAYSEFPMSSIPDMPIVHHTFRSIRIEEIMNDRSSRYNFINFNNKPIGEEEYYKGC